MITPCREKFSLQGVFKFARKATGGAAGAMPPLPRYPAPRVLRAVPLVAAAAKNDQRKNDDPAAVVVAKDITEAVVHKMFLL